MLLPQLFIACVAIASSFAGTIQKRQAPTTTRPECIPDDCPYPGDCEEPVLPPDACCPICIDEFELEVKPGTCPEIANDVFGICIERCIGDGSCDGNEKCCSNGCGRVCMAPVAEDDNCAATSCLRVDCEGAYTPEGECCRVCPNLEKSGYCPLRTEAGTCDLQVDCAVDNDCSGDLKCCQNECGSTCTIPTDHDCRLVRCAQPICEEYITPPDACCPICRETERPGICPAPTEDAFEICQTECEFDQECADEKKCCFNGCGHVCTVPEKEPDCSMVDCLDLDCEVSYVPAGQCCPVCQTACKYNGGKYDSGSSFPSIDGCNTCFCENMEVSCTKIDCCSEVVCEHTECKEPVLSADGCCRICPEPCEYMGSNYKSGDIFASGDGCNECSCNDGEVGCTEMACVCSNGQDGGCGGIAGFRCKEGTECMFMPEYPDAMGKCCIIEPEDEPAVKEGECPPAGIGICLEGCTDDFSCDGKQKCCSNGCGHVCMDPIPEEIDCSLIQCAKPECDNPVTPDGECCPVCPQIDCSTVRCAAPECDNPVTPDGACCQICPAVKEGECPPAGIGICLEGCTDDFSCDGKQKCCSNGCGHVCMDPIPEEIDCSTVPCAKPECDNPVTPDGECCPVCPQIDCSTVLCAKPECDNPVTPDGECCPVCPPTVKEGECPPAGIGICLEGCTDDFSCDGKQKCCSNGCGRVCMDPIPEEPDCSATLCMIPECDNPVRPDGECCSICPTPQELDCSGIRCRRPRCKRPVKLPDQCCPVCSKEEPPKPDCSNVRCRRPRCPRPMNVRGECCPVCPRAYLLEQMCRSAVCPNTECKRPRYIPGNCCPICKGRRSIRWPFKIGTEKLGVCPAYRGIQLLGKCPADCTCDRECPGTTKCCTLGCGRACMEPITTQYEN